MSSRGIWRLRMVLSDREWVSSYDRWMAASSFAMRWLLNNRLVSSVIAGPRTVAQWEAYLA